MMKKKQKKKKRKKKKKKKKIREISIVLNLNDVQLGECKDRSDITKTCRNITRVLYPRVQTRTKKPVSSMPSKTIQAINGKYRMRARNFITGFEYFQ